MEGRGMRDLRTMEAAMWALWARAGRALKSQSSRGGGGGMTEAVRCLMAISKGAAPLLSARPGLEVTLRLEIAHLLIAYPHPHALPHAKAHLDRAVRQILLFLTKDGDEDRFEGMLT
jgi:hypothetical protein